MTIGNNETIHISLGSTANYLTSHCLNLQGLAATNSDSGSGDNSGESLCDPSVTHDVRPLDGDDGYSSLKSQFGSVVVIFEEICLRSTDANHRRSRFVPTMGWW